MSIETRTIQKRARVPLIGAKVGFTWYRHTYSDGSRRHVMRPEIVFDLREAMTFRSDGVYRRRFQWWFPWGVTDWWLPRVWRGADEWCNDSACVNIPPLGAFVLLWHPGRLRTMPCMADWSILSDEEKADYQICGRLYGGKIRPGSHSHSEHPDCPAIGGTSWVPSRWSEGK